MSWADLLSRTSQSGFHQPKGKRCQIEPHHEPPVLHRARSSYKKNLSNLDISLQPRENKTPIKSSIILQVNKKVADQYQDNQRTYSLLRARNTSSEVSKYTHNDSSLNYSSIYKKEFAQQEAQPEPWKKIQTRQALPKSSLYRDLVRFKEIKDCAFSNSRYY